MAMRVKKGRSHARARLIEDTKTIVGKRFYFTAVNGMHVSLKARNGVLAVKSLPSWVLL